ncbi:pilus assembly protein [Noviherbaspirillum aridicola]|uniref:Type IV pilus assembly protein PilX n=1 Tax=Noviherbaspirillum aridicola TaxID=2849687 RepID=A0ABQ4Q9F8_9BURK|nr:pilus assembly protein [Noviherbaspirillum aridicola]GIZ53835.1 hypothetical protein NCCP691_38490 [Noviherbaspirillum aridicola]
MRTSLFATQRGLSLAVVLMMLVIVLLLALAGARNALLAEKASRNDRDRQQALRAAEAALLDAQTEIMQSGQAPRHEVLAGRTVADLAPGTCVDAVDDPLLGVCRPSPTDTVPPSLRSWLRDGEAGCPGVPYGRFTGRHFPHGEGPLPIQPPHYLIEVLEGGPPGRRERRFRITAIGFGPRAGAHVILQAWFRIAGAGQGGERLAWRELTDWSSDEQNEH